MASKSFVINTEPHRAVIGDTTLLFQAEVVGAEFAQAYDQLRVVQASLKGATGNKASGTKHAKESTVDATTLTKLSEAMREFVGRFLLDESRPAFDELRLPDRILVELLEWVAELYGSGSGNPAAAGGTSSD